MSPKDMPEELLQCMEFPTHIWWKGRGTEWGLGKFHAANLLPWAIAKASALREQGVLSSCLASDTAKPLCWLLLTGIGSKQQWENKGKGKSLKEF